MFNNNILVISILFLKTYEILLYCTSKTNDFSGRNFYALVAIVCFIF